MLWQFEFGIQSLDVNIPEDLLLGNFRGPRGGAIDHVADVVRERMDEPLNAPPLVQAVVPGDHVAIALDSDLPQSELVIVPLLEQLVAAGVEPRDVTIVTTPAESRRHIDQLIEGIPEALADVVVVTHNPEDVDSHAYLASTKDGRRIYLNRQITDADTFVVIGRAGFDSLVGHSGTASYLFPALSNADTQRQSRVLAMELTGAGEGLRVRQICDEVGWLLGLFYGFAVALDRDNAVDAIWFGHFPNVQQAAEAHSRDFWSVEAPEEVPDLVVASLSRSDSKGSWAAVATALQTATKLAGAGSKILLLTDLAGPLGPTGRWLIDNENPWDVLARVREATEADSLITAEIASALAANRIHLYSGLNADLVESLAMVPVGSPREVENLIAHSESVFIVEDADRARVIAS